MVIPNMVMKFHNFDIFYKMCIFFHLSPAAWKALIQVQSHIKSPFSTVSPPSTCRCGFAWHQITLFFCQYILAYFLGQCQFWLLVSYQPYPLYHQSSTVRSYHTIFFSSSKLLELCGCNKHDKLTFSPTEHRMTQPFLFKSISLTFVFVATKSQTGAICYLFVMLRLNSSELSQVALIRRYIS